MRPPHENLKVWQLSYETAIAVCRLMGGLPREEQFGLASQLRRAVMAIPANIAEGNARESIREYLHFLQIARSSLAEVRNFLRAVVDLGYLSETKFADLTQKYDQVGKMLHFLMISLRRRQA